MSKQKTEGLIDMATKDVKQSKFADDGFEEIQHNKGGTKTFISFSKMEDGATIIGEFIAVEEGKFGPEASVIDKDGQINVFVLTAGLSDFKDEEKIKPGQMVKVVHLGLKEGKNGKNFRAFQVFTKKA
jgi:hypothetical protein